VAVKFVAPITIGVADVPIDPVTAVIVRLLLKIGGLLKAAVIEPNPLAMIVVEVELVPEVTPCNAPNILIFPLPVLARLITEALMFPMLLTPVKLNELAEPFTKVELDAVSRILTVPPGALAEMNGALTETWVNCPMPPVPAVRIAEAAVRPIELAAGSIEPVPPVVIVKVVREAFMPTSPPYTILPPNEPAWAEKEPLRKPFKTEALLLTGIADKRVTGPPEEVPVALIPTLIP
jgi:hypothetical protein